jgi:hypothetical protein
MPKASKDRLVLQESTRLIKQACTHEAYYNGCVNVVSKKKPSSRMQAHSNMHFSAAHCSVEAHSGGALEEHLALLSLSTDTAQEAELAQAVELSDGTAALSVRSLSDELSLWCTSEHAVYCGYIENVIAKAAALGGHSVALFGLQAIEQALDNLQAPVCGVGGAGDFRVSLQVHVLCRCAGRCVHRMCPKAASGAELMRHGMRAIEEVMRAQEAHGWDAPSSAAAALAGVADFCSFWCALRIRAG